MCFVHDCDSITLDWRHVRARKSARCYDCHGAVHVGEHYLRCAWLYDGHISSAKVCERCNWLIARIYAEERAEGCMPHESWPEVGSGDLEKMYRERTWYLRQEEEV